MLKVFISLSIRLSNSYNYKIVMGGRFARLSPNDSGKGSWRARLIRPDASAFAHYFNLFVTLYDNIPAL
jgi:hypothetical protein